MIFVSLVESFVPGSFGHSKKEINTDIYTQTISMRGTTVLRYAVASFREHGFTSERATQLVHVRQLI